MQHHHFHQPMFSIAVYRSAQLFCLPRHNADILLVEVILLVEHVGGRGGGAG